jgi:hypothetical protein
VRGALRIQFSRDDLQNPIGIREHVVIPESKDTTAMLGEPPVTLDVAWIVGMLSSVYLDDEPPLSADKVHSGSSDRLLPNKLVTVQLARSEAIPKACLCVGGIETQVSGTVGSGEFGLAHLRRLLC